MLKKLRADFSPEYIAAIFESGATFRDEQAATRKAIQKFDIKSQSFTEVAYAGDGESGAWVALGDVDRAGQTCAPHRSSTAD